MRSSGDVIKDLLKAGKRASFGANGGRPLSSGIQLYSTGPNSRVLNRNKSFDITNSSNVSYNTASTYAAIVATMQSHGHSKEDLEKIFKEKAEKALESIQDPSKLPSPIFYRPETISEGKDVLSSVDASEVASTNMLVMFSIVVNKKEAAEKALEALSVLTDSQSFEELNRNLNGAVICIPQSPMNYRDASTIKWLMDQDVKNIPPEVRQIYDSFLKPKLFKADGTLVSSNSFKGFKAATESYSNRFIDMLLALAHEDITKAGGKPQEYFKKIHVLSSVCNPYDWVSDNKRPKWQEDVIKYVRRDLLVNPSDILTRIPSRVMPMLQHATFHAIEDGTLVFKLKDSLSFMRIVTPRPDKNYGGHDSVMMAHAVKAQHSSFFYNGLKHYWREGDIEGFDFHRSKAAAEIDPSEPIESGKVDPITGLNALQRWFVQFKMPILASGVYSAPGPYAAVNKRTYFIVSPEGAKPPLGKPLSEADQEKTSSKHTAAVLNKESSSHSGGMAKG